MTNRASAGDSAEFGDRDECSLIWVVTAPVAALSYLDVLKMIFNFVLGPPLPRRVPGEAPDCHLPKEI